MIKLLKLFKVSFILCFFMVNFGFSQKKINQVDANGQKTGVWKKYYKNGNIRYKGQFLNGKEIGTFKFYEPHVTIPTIVKEFSSGSDLALVKFYTRKGKIKAEGKMRGKQRIGVWTYYYNNGKVFSIENYQNGKFNGVVKNFYANGNVTSEVYYVNGVKSGVSKTYSDEGILIEEVTFSNNVLNGPAKFFDLKGNLTEKGSFVNGIRKGQWDFYVDGQLTEKPKKKSFSLNE